MIAIACDPGINGAIAMVCSRRGVLEVADLPIVALQTGAKSRTQNKVDARPLRALLSEWSRRHELAGEDVVGVVERMQAFRSSPVTLLSMGHTAGLVEGVMSAWARALLQPTPSQWKQALGITSDKATSQAEIRRRFPLLGRMRHDKAEAILLGCWAIEMTDGGPVTHDVCKWVPA